MSRVPITQTAEDMLRRCCLGPASEVGYQGTVQYDHRSLLGLSMTALGVTTIPNGAGSAPQMTEFYP